MNPFVRKSMSILVIQPSFRALGEMQVKWQTFEKSENKRQMYGSGSTQACPTIHLSLIFRFFKCLPFHLHLAQSSETLAVSLNYVDMLFLMSGFICLFNENKVMLISGGHI